MNNRPNLFSLATSELSQDAFIAWLLQWAAPEFSEQNPKLGEVASAFVRHLIGLQATAPERITRVKAGRQWENIDVWAEVNDSHLIIIEDKVGTSEHSGQLARYRAIAQQWCDEHKCILVCVYLKTQSDSAANCGGLPIKDMRSCIGGTFWLSSTPTRSVTTSIRIFVITSASSSIESPPIRAKPIGTWGGDDWKGLYQALEVAGVVENWGYVNNPSGGFWNAILNWYEAADGYPYMQIEQGNLCFKIGEITEEQAAIRNRYHKLLMSRGGSEMGLSKPARFRSGLYMTVAIVPRSIWLGAEDAILDLPRVVERLARYKSWFVEILGLGLEEAGRGE